MRPLLASSGTLESITKLASEYLYGTVVTVAPSGKTWTISTSRGIVPGLIIKHKGGRYRLEAVPKGDA